MCPSQQPFVFYLNCNIYYLCLQSAQTIALWRKADWIIVSASRDYPGDGRQPCVEPEPEAACDKENSKKGLRDRDRHCCSTHTHTHFLCYQSHTHTHTQPHALAQLLPGSSAVQTVFWMSSSSICLPGKHDSCCDCVGMITQVLQTEEVGCRCAAKLMGHGFIDAQVTTGTWKL